MPVALVLEPASGASADALVVGGASWRCVVAASPWPVAAAVVESAAALAEGSVGVEAGRVGLELVEYAAVFDWIADPAR